MILNQQRELKEEMNNWKKQQFYKENEEVREVKRRQMEYDLLVK